MLKRPIARRSFMTGSAAGAATLLTAGPGALAQAKEYTLGNINPPKHGTSVAAEQFIAKLAELSGGKIKVTHHHSGALGGERETSQQIQLGAVDFGPITTAPLSTLVPEMSVFQLPYIFRDYDHLFKDARRLRHAHEVLRWRARQEGPEARSASSPPATAASTATYPINSVADIKGKKIRVQEDKILVATFKALGMISTPIAFPEVATSLQTKVIEFAEGGINTFYHNKFYDIVKYVADVRHTHQAVALIMSKATFGKLDPDSQKAIPAAWEQARTFNRKFILDEDKSIQDHVRAKG